MKSDDMERLIDQITLHEGLRLKPYRCTAGKLTIGIGRNLDDVGISKDEADMLLKNDIEKVIGQLSNSLPWYKNLNKIRQRVLIDMAFNLGIAGLLKFKNTLGHIQAGRWPEAAKGMLASRWAKQVGRRAERLATMMQTGLDYQ